MDNYTHDHMRFHLVKIVFREFITYYSYDSAKCARRTVEYVDAVLAEMEKTPDTGPSADEIARRARKLAGDVLTGMETEPEAERTNDKK